MKTEENTCKCKICDGSGIVSSFQIRNVPGFGYTNMERCWNCNGTGKVDNGLVDNKKKEVYETTR